MNNPLAVLKMSMLFIIVVILVTIIGVLTQHWIGKKDPKEKASKGYYIFFLIFSACTVALIVFTGVIPAILTLTAQK